MAKEWYQASFVSEEVLENRSEGILWWNDRGSDQPIISGDQLDEVNSTKSIRGTTC